MDLLPAAANLLQLSLDGWSDLRDTSGLLSSSHALLASEFLLTYSIRLVQIQVVPDIDVSHLVSLLYIGLDVSCYLICIPSSWVFLTFVFPKAAQVSQDKPSSVKWTELLSDWQVA